MTKHCLILTSRYYDSVTLMNVARDLQDTLGVEDAALLMGTDANKGLLQQTDLLTAVAEGATPNDLIIALKGNKKGIKAALERVEILLTRSSRSESGSQKWNPKTLRTAIRTQGDANLAVISVAGRYAAAESMDALRAGLNVLLFSDNVPIEDELALKRYAVEHDLFLMGPGAGTSILNGVALGFANALPSGPVGIVSAAGTGLQEVSCILAREGVGVSQGIGVGGRDLSDEIDGLMTLHALKALQDDPDTEVIVAISKIPSPTVAQKVLTKLTSNNKPSVVIFMGESLSSSKTKKAIHEGLYLANTLEEAALAAAALARKENVEQVVFHLEEQKRKLEGRAREIVSRLQPEQKYLRGLFSGGTLCEEAMRIWEAEVGPVWSNAPLNPEYTLPDSHKSSEHTAVDLGEEEFTVGRPHPMIDHDLRIRRLYHEAQDPNVALIQMDVVLGYGAHPDPASALAPAIEKARAIAEKDGRALAVVLSITGTKGDPQGFDRQRDAFEKCGAIVAESNAAASILAAMIIHLHALT
ncbi:MAG TPA: acyl-CoA synthetase FdrA [Anaerolineales bacterium]|nr:acyl-CoA synthetase FdrA [Anaerolineales bacterium]